MTFRPTATGSRSANVSVADNAPSSPQTVPLTGTGVSAGPVTLSPSILSFGTIPKGTLSGWQNVTISNATGSTITLTSYSFTGTNSADFLAYAAYNNTGVWTNNGGAGEAWTLGQFIVDSNGNFEVVTTAGTGGTGTHPTWATILGQPTTDGGAVWNLIGTYPNGCGTTLATGSSCVIVVAFEPSAVGGTNETATLNVNFTGGGTSPVTAPVTGTSGSGFVVPNATTAPTPVNLPLIITQTAINPNGAALNLSLLTPTTTYTVCASGCNYTDSQLQTALNQAFSDCQTNTSLVQLYNTETVSTTGINIGNGTNGCAAGKWLRWETNRTDLLPADGNRINHSYAGVMPQIVVSGSSDYAVQLAHNMSDFEMRGIEFSNSGSYVTQMNQTFRCSDELVTATASIPRNVILDQNIFWGAGATANLTHDAILLDCNNAAVINSDVENYQATQNDNQAITIFCSNGPYLISNNTLSATTENTLIGGNGCAITDGGVGGNPFPNPSNGTVVSNWIFKPLRWRNVLCGSTTGDCGAGQSFVTLSPQPTTSACTGSQCQVNVSFSAASEHPDMHPYDNAVLQNCANTLFNGSYAILLSPLPTNGTAPFTFSVINTNLNSTNAPNGTTTTGCTIAGFFDPQWVAPGDGSFFYDIKNLTEMKQGKNWLYQGNFFATTWLGGQCEALIFQEGNPVQATLNYAPWDESGNTRVTMNVWTLGDINGWGMCQWTALNPVINGSGVGSSLGTTAGFEFDNDLVYQMGPQFGYYEEWGSHSNTAGPLANGQLQDLFVNHVDILQNSVNPATGNFELYQFASPANLMPGQTPFLRDAVDNSLIDFGQISAESVLFPYNGQKCEINSGLAVPCWTPAAWVANIPVATVAGSGAPYGCTNANSTASFQPNAGPHGLGSSFCPTANLAAVGFVNTTINTASSPISPGINTVTPASMANISATAPYNVLFVGSSTNAEFVAVTAITGTTFTANFANAHNSNITPVYGTTLPSTSVGHATGTDGLDVGANGPAVVAMTQWVPSGNPSAQPAVTIAPTFLTFASQALTTTSPTQFVQLYNTGGVTLSISGITITGANSGDFAQTNNCGSSVLAGGSCTIIATFTPSGNGSRSASISIADSAAGSPQTVPMTGTGYTPTPTVSVSPSSLTFATQTVGTPSNAQAIIVTNTGTATVTFSSISITGANAGDYGQTNTCGASLVVNASCSILVTFMPTTSGTRTANVSIADNVAGSPQTVALSGTGITGPLVAPDPGMFSMLQ